MAEAGLEGIYEENGDFHSLETARETDEKGKRRSEARKRSGGRVSANFILARARRRRLRSQASKSVLRNAHARARGRSQNSRAATHV